MATHPAKSNKVTVPGPGAPPAALRNRLSTMQGRGVSTAQEDNQTPIVRVLQAQSPQVNSRNPEYVEGAQAGDIFLKNAPVQIIKGEEGFDFQPCYFSKDIIEWTPRDSGGGFVARHPFRSGEAAEHVYARIGAISRQEDGDNRPRWVMPNGNELVETRNHAGFVLYEGEAWPFVIALSGSGLSVSREWMGIMGRKRVRDDDGKSVPVDAWACAYRLKTQYRKNTQGEWFVLKPDQGRWLETDEDLDRGEALYNAFASGERVVADDTGGVEHNDNSEARATGAGI